MCFHYFYGGPRNENTTSIESFGPVSAVAEYGFVGVALFFMISGFVIVNSAARRSARDFAVGRIVRLYPAFVVCMSVTAAVSVFWGGPQMTVSLSQFLANLTMNAPMFGYEWVDGVYWTLLCEIKFYLAVFVIILLGQARHLENIFYGWIVVLVWVEFSGQILPLTGHYFPLFAGGGLLAFIHRHGFNPTRIIFLFIIAAISTMQAMERAEADDHNAFLVGVISLSFYLAFLVLLHVGSIDLPHSRTLGALTYPLYLLHAHIGYMALNHLASEATKWPIVILIMGVMLGGSYLVATFVEARPRAIWYKIADRSIGVLVGAVEDLKPQLRLQMLFRKLFRMHRNDSGAFRRR